MRSEQTSFIGRWFRRSERQESRIVAGSFRPEENHFDTVAPRKNLRAKFTDRLLFSLLEEKMSLTV